MGLPPGPCARGWGVAETRERLIDALLEVHLFGAEELPWKGLGWARSIKRNGTFVGGPRRLSTTWDGMGLVIEAMRGRGWRSVQHAWALSSPAPLLAPNRAGFFRGFASEGTARQGIADADTLPMAVALAALAALGIEAPDAGS